MARDRMARTVKFLPYHLKHKQRGRPSKGKARASHGLLLRGVIQKAYLPDDPADVARVAVRGQAPASEKGILCDVLITDPEYKAYLKDVPVMVQSGGLNDHEIWRPRATTIALDPVAALNFSLEGLPLPTVPSHLMDGDQVVVGFLGNDINQPVILGQFAHPRTHRKPTFLDTAAGKPQFKWRRYVRGLDIGVTQAGNIRIDMQKASAGLVTPVTGIEIPAPGPDPLNADVLGGNMLITMFTGDLTTGTKITIADSVLSNPSPVILGSSWLTDSNTHLTDLNSWLSQMSLALTEMLGIGGLGLPVANITAAIAQTAVLQTAIAAYQAKIVASQAIGLPYLSSHLQVD